ncbi:MAG: TrmH family RNA methyltransferase [Burkholderiaceae bacterium]
MTPPAVLHIRSPANALLKDVRRLAQDGQAYRKQGRVWLEGQHLLDAALAKGLEPLFCVFSESYWPVASVKFAGIATKLIVLPDLLFASLSALESPAAMGFVIELPPQPEFAPQRPSVVLDRLQDAGNVGSILRSAAALGFEQIIALEGTAALWSPKVLRAGMGAHFSLRLMEQAALQQLDTLAVPLVVTSSHAGELLHRSPLPWPCAWVFGHEGQGVSQALMERAAFSVRIAQPGGQESLNVAAAAAICLHASAAHQAN